jgi:hypothetical protein
MLRSRVIFTLAVMMAVGIPISMLGMTGAAWAETCGGWDDLAEEYVACAGTGGSDGGSSGSPASDEQPCFAVEIGQPAADDPIWAQYIPAGADPADYVLMQTGCGATDWQSPDIFARLVNDEPPPDPWALAREAIARLPIPAPAIGLGPDAERIAVNVPLWLWVSNPDPVSASATDRTVTVTANAELASVTWSMGEQDAALVTCTGAGMAPSPGVDLWDPPCGYTYRLRSLPERTAGAGTWPVTAEATWSITWVANTGESGSDSVTVSSAARTAVGEYRTVFVAGT